MDPAQRVRLGQTDLHVTRLGLGLGPIGGLYSPVSDAEATATLDRAWDHGLRFFDTAPLYGYGSSERRAGAALCARPRADFVLSTKVGRLLVSGGDDTQDVWADLPAGVAPRFDFSYGGVMRSFEESRARLGFERIDVLHIHDPDHHFDEALSGALKALAELRAAGVIGAIGAGMNQAEMLTAFAKHGGFDCFILAGRYTLLDQSGLIELLPLCAKQRIGVIAAGVYQSGLLADPKPGATDNYHPVSQERLDRALALREVCESHGVPLRAAAIQFPFTHPAVTSVIVGVRTPEEVDDAVAMFSHPVPPSLWPELL
ncbi:MAG TPA: aldo/keto reductase [Micromonosporaceae bacterium]|nr:aldo/keto reductase [Micromonosporaceae bacterium]